MLRLPQLSFLTLSLLAASTSSYAEFHPSLFPFMPRVIGEGFFGDETLGEADALVPIYGNHGGIFYIDGMGKTGDDDGYLGSIGGGYRGIYNDRFLLGGYVFGDFNRVARGPHFPVVNPGLELMTSLWDIHVNGYFPTSPKQKVQGVFLGEQLGTTQYVSFAGHNQFDNLINLVEEVGNGVDGEVGLTLPMARNLRFYTGGYHFSFKESQDINGVIGGVEMPLNNYFTVSIRDSYDKVQKNTAQLTIRLTLGGMDKSGPPNVENRLLDPFRRHLGTWNTGSGIPSQEAYVNTGVRVLTRDNIWFFSSAGTPFVAANGFSNCTYENNCLDTSFSQTTVNSIDTISPNANFYLGSGSYGTFSGTSTFVAPQADFLTILTLNRGQSLYGRSNNFTTRGLRIIRGSLELAGDNNYDSLQLINNDNEFGAGLIIMDSSDVRVSNSIIGEASRKLGYREPVLIDRARDVVIDNSRIVAFVDNTTDSDISVNGVRITDSNRVALNNDVIVVSATQHGAAAVQCQGIFVIDSRLINIINSQLNVKVQNLAGQDVTARGLVLTRPLSEPLTIKNSTLNIDAISTGIGTSSAVMAEGISNASRVSVFDSVITVNSLNETSNGSSNAKIFNSEESSTLLTITRTSATASAKATGENATASALGLSVGREAIANLERAKITASAEASSTATAIGINETGFSIEKRATLNFAGMDIRSVAVANNSATAKALVAEWGLTEEVVSSNGTFLPSTINAEANSSFIAIAEGVELDNSIFTNNVKDNRSFDTQVTYNVAANGNLSSAIGVLAFNNSQATLFNSVLNVTTNNKPGIDFISSQNSVIRNCSFSGLILTGTCPVVGK